MKRKALIIFITLLTAGRIFAELYYDIQPRRVIKGEPVQLYLVNTEAYYPKIEKLPEVNGVEWISQTPQHSQSTQIINNRRTVKYTSIYTLIVKKAGKIRFPEFVISLRNKKVKFRKLELTAHERKFTVSDRNGEVSDAKLDDLIFQKVIVPADKKEFYVGEEIPLEIRVYGSTALNFQIASWPNIKLDKVIFRDFSNVNKTNRNFAPARKSVEELGGKDYETYAFSTSFRALSTGTLEGSVTTETAIRVRDQQRRRRSRLDDSFDSWGFFGRSNYRTIPRRLTTKLPELKIIPLPPAPEDIGNLGLVGNWRVTMNLTNTSLKVGDTTTLKIKIKGVGTLEPLKEPKLDIPGFRVYPAEVDKKYDPVTGRSLATINYVMIPTAKGKVKLDLTLATFNCAKGKYSKFHFSKDLDVKQSDVLTSSDEVFVSGSKQPDQYEPREKAPKQPRSGILYLKRKPSGRVELPLTGNYFFTYWILIILGPVLILIAGLVASYSKKFDKDPNLRRRRDALARRGKVLNKLKKASENDIDDVIQQEVVPYINDILTLPPGTTATELAEKVEDSNLKECLNNAGVSSYMPGAANINKSELKKRLIKAVKRVSVILLLFAMSFAADAATKTNNPKINSSIDALTAYDRGDFKQAEKYYLDQLDPHAPDPALLYNLGNCLCQQKKYARAMVCYERALRLKPGDSDIEENLNFVRRKLFLPEVGQIKNPLDLLIGVRDELRPDQWLLIAAAGWFMLCLTIALRRRLKGSKWLLSTIFALVLITSLTAACSQYRTTYSDSNAIIIGKHVRVYSLPSEKSGRSEFKLRNGQLVKIMEQRTDWIRVRAENGEGWIHGQDAARLWGSTNSKGLDKLVH